MTETSRMIVPADRNEQRIDLLLHGLAQLPDDVVLALTHTAIDDPALADLARAYGIFDRVREIESTSAGQTIFVSAPTLTGDVVRTMAEFVEDLYQAEDPPASFRTDDEVLSGHRVGIVTNVSTHYRVPLFNALSDRLQRAGASLRIFLQATSRPNRSWMKPGQLAFDYEILRTRQFRLGPRRLVMPVGLEDRLGAFRPTLLLSAGFSPLISGRVARYASRDKVPFGVWSGELATRPTARARLRRLQRRWIIDQCQFAVSYGFRSGEYLRDLRSNLPVAYGRNTTLAGAAKKAKRPSPLEILAVSRALPGKGLTTAIDAVQLLGNEPAWRFTIAGEGPELPALMQRASTDPRIRILGAVPSDRVPSLYAASDVFVFPSRYDVFGLVLVEAMGAGVASIVSNDPGAVADLCVSGRNCLLVSDGGDVQEWASAIRRMLTDDHLRATLGENARRSIARRWTIEHAADAMVAGLRLGILASSRRAADSTALDSLRERAGSV
jgi:glycosyltransferase involved in cell wall biosynthesis